MPPESAPGIPQENVAAKSPNVMLITAAAVTAVIIIALFMLMRMWHSNDMIASIQPSTPVEKNTPAQGESLGADLYTKAHAPVEAPATANPINDAYKNPFN